MATVELKNISKVYEGNDIKVVKDANVLINDQEFVVLVGPSGCGKSTMLRMIAGLEEITSGELYIGEKKMNDVAPKNRDIAMVFQNYALYPHMTVFDNMAFGLKLRKFPKAEIKQRVEEAADILDIQDFLDRKPKALSGGQRQRVAIGRAIVRKPKVFLFDEPLSNLDAKLRVQMRIEINRLHTRLKSTMIYVTHDQVEAMTMGDRIVVLKDGVVQQVDTPINLYKLPHNLFVAGFIGSPGMNFIKGTLVKNEKWQFHSQEMQLSLPEKTGEKLKTSITSDEITLGVRPECVYDAQNQNHKNLSGRHSFTIDVVEPVGNEIFLYISKGNQTLCMRTPVEQAYQVNANIQVVFDLDKLHFFDTRTEKRIV